jgi:hypothetical protein
LLTANELDAALSKQPIRTDILSSLLNKEICYQPMMRDIPLSLLKKGNLLTANKKGIEELYAANENRHIGTLTSTKQGNFFINQ